MAKPDMQTFRCTVHNIVFSVERLEGNQDALARCPYCANEELARLRTVRDKLAAQNKLLLGAIDLKRLIETEGGGDGQG